MSRERFQSETGQTIDDNGCIFFASTSPLFYTVNPRSGISLRQQEPLGASSILKSFRNLPGCTRLSSSLSNLDSTSGSNKKAQFPLLPDINQKGSMGKSFQGHHSSSKRFVRERYNPPFKVNAKIRHVYTQEVTAIEGRDQQQQPNLNQQQPQNVSCHRQTQTELKLLSESKQQQERQEVDQINEGNESTTTKKMNEEKVEKLSDQKIKELTTLNKIAGEIVGETDKRDQGTSPIPSPYFPSTSERDSTSPFTGCSQMNVYPPLNYVRKLEDLEKITGHIVIQRFFTRTDDVFGSWLEKQLGMTSKSVSVDTSEFENAKTAEIQDEEEADDENTNDKKEGGDAEEKIKHALTNLMIKGDETNREETITGAINNQGEGGLQESSSVTITDKPDCALSDPIKCECYLNEIDKQDEDCNELKDIEEQIISIENLPNMVKFEAVSARTDADVKNEDEVETLISSSVTTENASIPYNCKNLKSDEDIDEVVRCTLEAYLLAPAAFEDMNENVDNHDETFFQETNSPLGTVKSEVDSGRADSIRSQDKGGVEGFDEIEGNTSHDSVETVYEIAMAPLKNADDLKPAETDSSARILQRSLSADSCIGTESSGDAKNPATNASQSSNDTIEGLDPIITTVKEVLDVDSPASAPPTITKLPSIHSTIKAIAIARKISAKSHRSLTPSSATGAMRVTTRRNGKTDNNNAESEDADGESETESEITDNNLLTNAKLNSSGKHHHHDGTDLELEEVEEYERDDDDRDAFDAMVANHLKYSRGFSTGTNRRSRLNRGTQTTKSIEPSTTTSSGSMSPSSSSNSSFDVEIVSKSTRMTTTSSSGGGVNSQEQHGLITPSNMTLAWHDGGRRRSYLPSSSSSLNLLNMKFSLGKDFESEVSIRMPTNKSSANTANMSSASMLLSGGGETGPGGGLGGKTLLSSSTRTHHQSYYQSRGLSPGRNHPQFHAQEQQHPLLSSATSFPTMQPTTLSGGSEPTELQSLWKDVRTKLDVQVDEMSLPIQEEQERPVNESLEVRGNGILPTDSVTVAHPGSGSTSVKIRRNEERIKRSLQRLKKILDD